MNHTLGTNKWFVYIVQCNDNSLYTGITTDIDRRINEHNTSLKGAKYTRNKRPVTLVYFEMAIDRSMASKRESEIKKLSRINKLKLIDNFKIILN
jgi:putative endonuclease